MPAHRPSAMADQLTAGDLDAIAAIVATHHKITTARERLLRLLRTEADARRTTTESDAPQPVAGPGGTVGRRLDALRIIERAPEPEPEPGAGIPDEVVDEALDSFMNALEGHERPKGLAADVESDSWEVES